MYGQETHSQGQLVLPPSYDADAESSSGTLQDSAVESLASSAERATDSCRRAAARSVSRNPGAAVLAVFGAGFGAGVLLARTLARSDREHSSILEQTLGKQVLRSLEGVVPGALREALSR